MFELFFEWEVWMWVCMDFWFVVVYFGSVIWIWVF